MCAIYSIVDKSALDLNAKGNNDEEEEEAV